MKNIHPLVFSFSGEALNYRHTEAIISCFSDMKHSGSLVQVEREGGKKSMERLFNLFLTFSSSQSLGI